MGHQLSMFFTSDGHLAHIETLPWDDRPPDDSAPVLKSKDDVYQPETLSWLLRQVGISDANQHWILRDFDAGQIVLVCCYVIHQDRLGKIKTNRTALACATFKQRYPIGDFRAEVLNSICAKQPSAKTPQQAIAEMNEVHEADRKKAAAMLAQFQQSLFKNVSDLDDAK